MTICRKKNKKVPVQLTLVYGKLKRFHCNLRDTPSGGLPITKQDQLKTIPMRRLYYPGFKVG